MTDTDKKELVSKYDAPIIAISVLLGETREVISRATNRELKKFGINIQQSKVLNLLSKRRDGATLNEIAEFSLREFHSAAALMNRMEAKGLVKKVKKPGNNKTYFMLTEKSREIVYEKLTTNSIDLIFSVLTEEESLQLQNSLKKLKDKARDLLGLNYKFPF